MSISKAIFATAEDAEASFYDALERADLEAMMSVWAEDEEIVCVHPGGPRVTGYAAVREAWRRVFEHGQQLRVRLQAPTVVQGPFSAVHTVIELVSVPGEEQKRTPIVATNVFVRGPAGWRMVVHHASPAPPDSIGEPRTLH